eukprot:TRINITY_DN391_c0_g3_i2.p1 TRINITY_DN391_c0_g3~~TRINITY_DN391_c0_g3_i2.p1  ORF type:complete len:403 (-),score=236.63 TRINITY_DN391_c0_g3_i2:91-1299(-)
MHTQKLLESRKVFIVAAKRTPFGAFGGKLTNVSATQLAVHSSRAAITAAGIQPQHINSVIFGNVAQTSGDAAYLARHVGLKSGVPISAPALTINRLCGSGFQAVINASQEILLDESSVVLCGGTENMSQAPYAVRSIRFENPKLGKGPVFEDTLWQALTDSHINTPMGITAENLADQYGITRQECDEFALQSQKNWANANANKHFASEIEPIEVKLKKPIIVDTDEHPRPDTKIEDLTSLKPVFKENGRVTAGNASGISDGSASLILASGEAVKNLGLKPLARIVSWSYVGVEPSIMGIGPVQAIQNSLNRASLKLSDMDLIEVNEAFASQSVAVAKGLGIDPKILNRSGGAIALGHPLGASGARITTHLVHEMKRTNKKYSVGSACIGGGQGIAIILENSN